MATEYFAYMVLCADGTYYAGYTDNLTRRLRAHNNGTGARYTRSRGPVTLAHFEAFLTKGEALRQEYRFKQLTHQQKALLCSAEPVQSPPENNTKADA